MVTECLMFDLVGLRAALFSLILNVLFRNVLAKLISLI